MSLSDLAFALGPLGAPFVGVACIVAMAVIRPPLAAVVVGIVLWGVTAVSWLTYWILWGRSFDELDAGLDPSTGLEVASTAAAWTSATGCVALVLTVIVAASSARRAKPALP